MSQPTNPSSPFQSVEITLLRTRLSSAHQTRDSLKKSLNELKTRQISDSSDLSTLLFQINECQAEAESVADCSMRSSRGKEYTYLVESIKTMNWVRERCVREYEELGAKIERMERENVRLEREIWGLAKMLNPLTSWGSLDAGRTFES